MKTRLLLFSLFVFALYSANAQISITQNDMPSVGKSFVSGDDTIYAGLTVGPSGANKTWNFSNLVAQTNDTANFVSPGSLTGASNFPTANLGMTNAGQNIFLNYSSSAIDIIGIYQDFGSPAGYNAVKFNPAIRHISLPSTYNTTFNGTSTYEIKFPVSGYPGVDSAKADYSQQYISLVDGWGTITTPVFTNVACLRQFMNTVTTSTNYIHPTGGAWTLSPSTPSNPNPTIDTTYEYTWWSNTEKYTLADIQTNAQGNVTNANYLLKDVSGIKEPTISNKMNVFPNPASDLITLEWDNYAKEGAEVSIYDIRGQLILQKEINSSFTNFDIQNFSKGVYFITLKDSKSIIEKKFIKE